MKLSLACTLATFVSLAAFVAIFVLSALLYENLNVPMDLAYENSATQSPSSEPARQIKESNTTVAEFRTNFLPNSDSANSPAIPRFETGQGQIASDLPPAPTVVPEQNVVPTNATETERFFDASSNVFEGNNGKSLTASDTRAEKGSTQTRQQARLQPLENLLPEFETLDQQSETNAITEYLDFDGQLDLRVTPQVEEQETRHDSQWLRGLAGQQKAIDSADPFDKQFDPQMDRQQVLARMVSQTPTVEKNPPEVVPAHAAAAISLGLVNEPGTIAAEAVAVNPGADLLIELTKTTPNPEIAVGQDEIESPNRLPNREAPHKDQLANLSPAEDLPATQLPSKPSSVNDLQGLQMVERSGGNEPDSTANQLTAKPKATDSDQSAVSETSQGQTRELIATTPKSQSASDKNTEIVGWPMPESLLKDLEHLHEYALTQDWATAATNAFEELNQLELGDPEAKAWIDHCHEMAKTLRDHVSALAISQPQYQASCAYMSQVAHRMKRRAEIWAQVHKLAARNYGDSAEIFGSVVAEQISRRTRTLDLDSLDPLWVDYLMLERAQEIFSDPKSKPIKYRAISQKILARTTSSALSPEQMQFAQSVIGDELGLVLKNVAAGPLDLGQFLVDVEKFEYRSSSAATGRLTSHFQNYYWNQDPEIQVLARLIDDHYRNANLQIEISQELINRMIPDATTHHEPVTDRILGASVFGQSRITNRIHVQLVPDPDHLSFRLQSNGRVLSNTRAHARGFTFSNLGNGLVNASKVIAVGEEGGISAAPTNVNATSQNRLIGVQGQLDNVPVFGSFARRMAQQQHQSQGNQAKQIVENKMRSEFRSRIDDELQKQIVQTRHWFQSQVLDPLHAMELEPKVIQLQTTQQEAVVRYRLASLDQIGANTPRPASQPGSLASFQLHRSAINNVINRIHINGRRFTPQEFMEHLNMLLGRTDLVIPLEQNRDDVTFEFASRDAVMLDFQDNNLCIKLRIKRLQVGKRNRWKNLTITAQYSPTAMGQRLYLEFNEDHGLSVSGKLRLADQLAVRTVFSALFKPTFQFDLLPPAIANQRATQGLGISQLVLSQGWLSVSLNQMHAHSRITDQRSSAPKSWLPAAPRQDARAQTSSPGRAASRNPGDRASRFYRPQAWHGGSKWR